MARIKYRSIEAQERRNLHLKRLTIIFSIFTVFMLTGTIFFLRINSIQIREINIEGTNIIDKKEVKDIVDSSLSGKYLWLIPKSNTFLYSTKDLHKELLAKFPGILSLDVNKDNFKKINIKIVERKPQDLWCRYGNEESVPECYFVDSAGMIFASAPFFSGNVYFIFKGELGKEDPLGVQIFTTENFLLFKSFVKQIENKLKLSVVSAELKGGEDFDLILSSGLKIMLNKNISYDDMYNNMDALFKSKEFSASSSKLNSLEYVDMRFGNKVYFK